MLDEIIKKMEAQIDTDDFEYIQEECMSEIEKKDLGLSAVEPLLQFIERHPVSDFGMPGEIVHYLESLEGYEDKLVDSINRRPTLHTVWMINRIKNTGENYEKYTKILNGVLECKDIEDEIKESVKQFLED